MRKKNWIVGMTVAMSVLTAVPAYAGTWIQDASKPVNENGISNWWYQNDDGSYLSNGWFWLDGNHDGYAESYRFDENGWMYADTTVDGYTVNGNGAWTETGVVQYKSVSNVIYAKNVSVIHVDRSNKEKNKDEWDDTSDYDKEGWFDDYERDDDEKDTAYSNLTDEEAYEKLIELQEDYPEGMKWTNSNKYFSKKRNTLGGGCAGFAFIASDYVFGKDSPYKRCNELEWEELRVGDHIRMKNSQGTPHSVIILEIHEDSIVVCEGNFNSSIHWGREFTRGVLEERFIYRETCYE